MKPNTNSLLQPPDQKIPRASTHLSSWMTVFLAAACGLLAANIYYAQPLVGLIGASLGLPRAATGLIVTMTQIGYGAGLLLIVPLGDLFENRRLTLVLVVLAAVALLAAGASTQPGFFLAASLFVGLGTVAVQVLVPYAAHMAPEAERGRVVGNVMSGLMLGIMLARPVASFITQLSSWHVVFMLSGSAMAGLALLLGWMLPRRVPTSRLRYADLLASMGRIATTMPVLRRRALYHACLFGAFSLFWTTTPLLLTESFHLSQGEIALFALAGVAGAIAAPIAGRVADRGWTRIATWAAMLAVAGAFLMTSIGEPGSHWRLAFLVVAAVVLDFGVSAHMTLGQRAIFGLDPALRARLNGLYMSTFFIGGALGSGLGGWAYAEAGWWLTCCIGFALPVLALLYFATEPGTQTQTQT
ncbi:MFS transporter [Verminephrobacter eiseniae]|uniref:Major facilitator superfamily MFS_1 n=1 Tax=Verminephrobacter eiseniae (strain EF01-2) TaxID=391735 RepID=A1WGQ2_VEREI|nr:major facilitator superfamily MFS_1 [Verminephrobacter eiseniae EF01-2]MCW5287160.1 MFS transporter [Verminephrobacter eiseniae]MCW5305458.1 MFS transporter [Verminephrobacter eiseniae]MCW8180582.1 MFS transporter [Verminephrobacter eiseniae]MCW8189397.1 MFS transporter [Verminephrobacter eiseniae]